MIHYAVKVSILMTLSLVLLAQLLFNPALLSLIFAISIYHLFRNLKHESKTPPRIWIFILTSLALVSIYFSYQSFIGVEAGVAVLATFLFAKALETKTKRDVIILFNFALFVSASSFLHSQSIWMAMIILLCLFSCFIGLYRLQISEFLASKKQVIGLKTDAKYVGKFLLLALPFFILLFIFFPRLPPLWHIPIPEQKGITGMSDTMSPGDIAELSQSSSLAFRILGNMQQLPPRDQLYWRAMVLDQYDGKTWTSSFINQQPYSENEFSGTSKTNFEYQYLAADERVKWIMGLEKSIPMEPNFQLKQDWSITPRRQVVRNQPIKLQWVGEVQLTKISNTPSNLVERINIQTPSELDKQSRQFALKMFAQSQQQPERYIQHILEWYRENNFVYTLTPGLLNQNRVDEFLFQSRQGFCEHYASSFALLMRYVGIPARVVVGYQGGQLAPDRVSWEVRQLDAHAWTEVQIKGQWQRIDPTAMIAPERIDGGMQDYLENDQSVFGRSEQNWKYRQFSLLKDVRIWSDYVTYQWQSKVVGYDAEKQQSWLSKLGLKTVYAAVLALFTSIIVLLLFYFAWIYYRDRQSGNSFERVIQSFSQRQPVNLRKQTAETFYTWMYRLADSVEDAEQSVFFETAKYYQQQFSRVKNEQDIKQFKRMLKSCASMLKKSRKHLS